MLEKIAIHNVL